MSVLRLVLTGLAAFDCYIRIVVATQQSPIGIGGDPSQPWEPEIRKPTPPQLR